MDEVRVVDVIELEDVDTIVVPVVEVLPVVGVVVVLLVGLVDVELLVVDVDVLGGGHVSCTSVTLSVLTALAKNAPRRWAPAVSSSIALGAQSVAATLALREMRTRAPFASIRT